jgi:hypothetical protein
LREHTVLARLKNALCYGTEKRERYKYRYIDKKIPRFYPPEKQKKYTKQSTTID